MQKLFLILTAAALAHGAEPAPPLPADHAVRMTRGLESFQKDVAPLLKEHCLKCHGGEKTKGDFDLTTREDMLRGGKEGVAILPFNAKDSSLMKLIRHEEDPAMPDKKPKLPDDVIAKISAWIDDGAPYAESLIAGKAPKKDRAVVTEEDKQWWAFTKLQDFKTQDTRPDQIDAILLAKAKGKGLTFNPPADPRSLIRRMTLDLTGVPPTPDEVDAFIQSAIRNPKSAIEMLVTKLLDSPRYGERWARHWLDVARFAESSGFEHDYDRPFAFHYRDFVIKALNMDMPYDQFVRWQLAGDEFEPENALAMAATGFLGAGVYPTQITANEVERVRYDALDDMLSTTGNAMLGMTIGCARCHDHKYDPIPTKDYYRMLSTFTTTVRSNVHLRLDPNEPHPPRLTTMMICGEGYTPIRMHTQGGDFLNETHVLKRGNTELKDGIATQGFMQVLMRQADEKQWAYQPPAGAKFSGRRRALSNWMTDVDHGSGALLARVIVNRLWQHHFGRGIVSTPNDFGKQGTLPSQPELLDWLANELIRGGWKLKPIHKLIMMSAAYQQSSALDTAKEATDPANDLFMRRTPLRLEAESIRDAMLFVSGQLDETMFGSGTRDEASKRRSIYFNIKRSQLIGSMVAFDAPEPLVSQGARPTTTVAPQALMMMNSPQVRSWAEALAKKVQSGAGDMIAMGYQSCFSRPPSSEEITEANVFITQQREAYAAEKKPDPAALALADYCQVLFGLNEFVYQP